MIPSARRRANGLACAAACAVAICACGGADGWCVDRGSQTTYEGTLQYGGEARDTSGVAQSLAGGAPFELTVDDLSAQNQTNSSDPGSCDATFTLRLAGSACVLWGYPQSFRYDTGKNASGDFISADISVSAEQPCSLALAEGGVVVSVQTGSLEMTPGHAQLTFNGAVQSIDGSPRSGYLGIMYSSD